MAIAYPGFSEIYERWSTEVYRCCFLLVMEPEGAEQAALRAFLQLAVRTQACVTPESARNELFRWAVRCSEDHFYRRVRRKPKRESLARAVPFPVSDALWEFLQLPLKKKAAFYCKRYLGLSDEAAACVLGVRPGRAAQLAEWKGPYTDAEYKKAAAAVRPDKETERQLADLIYVECEGRHAALKQGGRRFKSALDRAAPWLALAVVLFGIAAVIYTAGLAG